MASTTLIAGSGSSVSPGAVAWGNPGNITATDSTDATAVISSGTTPSEHLLSADHGFAIPVGSTIDGLEATFRRKATNSSVVDSSVKMAKAGSPVGSNLSAGAAWGTSYGSITFGGPTELWGESWSVADINDAGFGAAISAANASSPNTASVDDVQISVYYTPADVDAQHRRKMAILYHYRMLQQVNSGPIR